MYYKVLLTKQYILTKIYIPHGFGTSIDNFEEKYVGYWKNGKKDGEGIINYLDEEYMGIKEVGEWKDGKQFNTITYDNDGAILGKCNHKPFTIATMNLEIDPDRSSCEIEIYFLKQIREKSNNQLSYIYF